MTMVMRFLLLLWGCRLHRNTWVVAAEVVGLAVVLVAMLTRNGEVVVDVAVRDLAVGPGVVHV
jgi:hypothetical protein